MSDRPEYPAHREADVVLRDDSTVHVRPIGPGDEASIAGFLRGPSENSRLLRSMAGSTGARTCERSS